MEENVKIHHKLGYLEDRREPYKGSVLVHMNKDFGP